MKRRIMNPYFAVFTLVVLLTACSAPSDDSTSSNSNAAQQANSNSQQPPIAQGNASSAAPGASPLTLQQLPPPAPAAKPVEKSMATATAKTETDASEHPPKLVAPEKQLDFGKQPQDKTMIRAIAIRNGGSGILNIESVTPS